MFLFKSIIASSTTLLNKVTARVLRAQIVFFDSNPVGRILTRFTKDVIVFDLLFPIQSLMFVNGIFRTISVVITVAVINPWILIPTAFCLVLMICVLKTGSRQLAETQRIDSIEREPVHSTFTMMITGLVSCRAGNKIDFFKQQFTHSLKTCANATFCNYSISNWMGSRLDLICVVFTSSVTWFCLIMKGKVEAQILLVTLQFISDLIAWFSYSIRLYADMENIMTCS
jgi:ATP-binding cassette, subfamily C (CFTR/MRP), member 4